ncbi:MAG: EAL domain-containing protein [Anaeroplasma sp.]
MRVRDLRWYILASVIIIISYAAVSLCYYFSIKSGKVESSMKSIALEVAQNEADLANDRIKQMYLSFLDDADNSLIEDGILSLCDQPTMVKGKFDSVTGDKILFQPYNVMEGNIDASQAKNTSYYFYFMKNDDSEYSRNGYLCVRIAPKDMFSFISKDFIIFDIDTSRIRYTNTNIESLQLNKPITSIIGDNYKDYMTDDIFNGIYSVDDNDCVITAVTLFDNFYFATLISTTDALLGADWVITQALIFFIVGVLVICGMLALFILGCRRASQLLRADRHAVEATKSMVIRIDPNGRVIFTNKTFKKMYGVTRLYSVDEFLDVNTGEPILTTIKENKSFECSVDVDGDLHYLHLSPLYISRSYYLMGTEITTDYIRRKHLEIMSGKNEFTNCDNGFILANQFRTILESNYGYNLAFIEYNIHKFNDIIQVFGRTNFNLLLNEILSTLTKVYENLGIYHMTDSKFMVIFPNSDISNVIEKVNETISEFQRPFTIKQNNIYVSTKVIIYNVKQEEFAEITLETIKSKLDLAYRNIANLSSKDYIIYDPAMDGIILAADEMEKDIEQGLIDKEFEMYLQPQFDIVSNQISGFEALIRWMNPKYKDKSPQSFIELAEQRGHMLDIGRFVITESFKLAKKLEPYGTHVSVNVSPVQLLQVGFVQQLIDEYNKLDLKPGSVAIEITETLLMENFNLVNEKLKMLKERGFHIHLDDFCTGYSSMLYLKDLPVDTIKIDKEFTKFIETNKVHENICKTICSLANSLDLGIVCEGVETQIQADMIKKMGCRVIQGYLIGKAMPYDEAVVLIEKYRK